MKLLNSYTLEIKKSKFIALYYEVFNEQDIKTLLTDLKRTYKSKTFALCL